MTKVTKRQGGSYVVDGNKTKKVEGTVEPEVSAPRDKDGNRLDETNQGGNVARNSGAALSAVHGVENNTGTRTENPTPPSNKKGDKK